MKSFFEFYQQIKEFTGAPTPGAPAAPGAAAPAPAGAQPAAPGASPAATIAGAMASQQQPAAGGDVDKFVQELKTMMGNTVNLNNFVEQLKKYISNQEFVQALLKGDANDALGVQETALPVSSMIPTQAEIFLDKSLDNGLANKFGNLNQLLQGDPGAIPGAVIVAEVGGGYHIIDGHHRWSQYASFNKDATCNCKVIKGLRTALEALKATHLAIAAVLQKVPLEPEKGTNLLTLDDGAIKAHVVDMVGKAGTLPVFQEVVPNVSSVDDAGNYIVGNTTVIKKQASSAAEKQPRDVMPQTGLAKGFDTKLSAGQVNVKFDHLVLAGILTQEQVDYIQKKNR